MAFYVGQKVVCVDADHTNDRRTQELDEGRVYTVERVSGDEAGYPAPPVHLRGAGTVVWLAEIKTRPAVKNPGCPFAASRFRPVVERKTDISELTAILNGKRIQLPDLVEEEARSGLADRFVGTVGVLAGGWMICVAVSFAQFLEMQ